MSKKEKKGPDYGKATPALVKQVKGVIAESENHRYSVSAVFGAYNAAFGKNDKPQTCRSCLVNRVRELRDWYKGYLSYTAGKKGKGDNPEDDETPLMTFIDIKTGEAVTLKVLKMENDEAEVQAEDGSPAPEGEYTHHFESGATVRVLVSNGKAVLVKPQYDDPGAPGFVEPATGVTRIPMAEGLPLDFTPGKEDPNKGTAVYADGTTVKPGTYKTGRGTDIAVQPGGKVTLKEEEEDLT